MFGKLLSRLATAIILGTLLCPAALASHRLLTLYGAGAQTGPTKQYNFITSGTPSLPSDITFTRSGNTATAGNSSGVITSVNANTPRFDYNLSTHGLNGLLEEQADTNFLQYSADLTQWAGGPSNATVTNVTSPVIAPDGSATVSEVNFTTAGTNFVQQNVLPTTPGSTYTFSFYALKGTATNLQYGIYDLSNNDPIVYHTGDYSAGLSAQAWTRLSVTFTAPAGCDFVAVLPSYNGTSTGTAYFTDAQLQLGSIATSYIPTPSTASVTQNIDSAKVTSIPWFSASHGTIKVQVMVEGINTLRNTTVASFNDGTTGNQIKIIINTAGVPEAQIISGGTTSTSGGTLSAIVPGSVFQAAITYQAGNNIFVANKIPDTAGTFGSATLPSGSMQLTIGDDAAGAQTLNGWVQALQYWNTAQSLAFDEQVTRIDAFDELAFAAIDPYRARPITHNLN